MKRLSSLDRTTTAAIGLVLAVALFFAVNIFAQGAFRDASLDLTQGGLYTPSQGTRQLLQSLKEPITLRFYFSQRLGQALPTFGNYAARVRELLERYASLSGGKIRLEFYDPEPFTDAEDRAESFGLQGVPVGQSGEQVYFGLAGTNSTDDEASIAFFQPDRERFLEYDVAKLISTLAHPKKKIVGVLSSLPMEGSYGNPMAGGQSTPPWTIMSEMRQEFDVRDLDDGTGKIDKDIDVLMVVHPKDLSLKTQFAIDQYILGGGRALIFVDPNAETDAGPSPMMMTGATSSDLPRLFNAWGIELVPGMVAGDRDLATRVQAPVNGRSEAVDYVAWLSLGQDEIDPNDVVTTDLSSLVLPTPGILEKEKGATIGFTPLLRTDADAEEIPASDVRMLPDPMGLLAHYKPGGHVLTLAARITGNVRSAFPDGPPVEQKAETKPGADKSAAAKAAAPKPGSWLEQSVKPINVIVVADADMLNDRFWVSTQDFFGQQVVTPTSGNGDFVMNALDNLAGSSALLSLRARSLSSRPFTLVQKLRAAADARYLAKAQALQDRLEDTRKKLASLQKEGAGSKQILSAAQQTEIDKFRDDLIATRKSLRDVQHALQVDIDRLEAVLKFVNIGLMPILIGIFALVLAWINAARRRKRYGQG
ncbi:MAG TPA: Gldg family protein [Alphaproteobacteria bacterium]|nr:Gldg family protein [Alphaproteobacteria bacterium]